MRALLLNCCFFLGLFSSASAISQTSSPWRVYEPTTPTNVDSNITSSATANQNKVPSQDVEQTQSYTASSTASTQPLDGRANVLECSPDEVQAYFEKPDRAREALNSYESFEKSYKQVEVVRSESDPASCLGMLYGDLNAMAEQMSDAISGVLSGGMPDLGALAQAAMEKLGESICKRVNQSSNAIQDRMISEANKTQKKARDDVNKAYGQRAMERYVNKSVMPPEFNDAGLKFKNGTIDDSRFKRSVDKKWKNELKELEDGVSDDIKD